jgi:hypothetical protein
MMRGGGAEGQRDVRQTSPSAASGQRGPFWGEVKCGSLFKKAAESQEVEQSRSRPQSTHCSNKLDTTNE